MRMALDNIASDNGEECKPGESPSGLEWEPGRLFNLEMIRQMRTAFDHYEKRAEKARAAK
jgi:hypothetical protein